MISRFDQWLTSDPRDDEWNAFEQFCAAEGYEPTDEDGQTDDYAWQEFQDARHREDYEPDDEPYYDDPSLDYL